MQSEEPILILGIGAQKAGTTWLEYWLRRAGVQFPGGKEVHFWDQLDQGQRPANTDWYRSLMNVECAHVADITPAYATLNESTVALVQRTCPRARIVFFVRNPMARAWSAVRMYAQLCQLQPNEIADDWAIGILRSQASRDRGDYLQTVERWGESFGSEALYVANYEELLHRPSTLLSRVAGHVGLKLSEALLAEPGLAQARRVGRSQAPSKRVVSALCEIYTPIIQRMQRYGLPGSEGWLNWPA